MDKLGASSSRIAVLDGWRAVSVGFVIVSHLIGASGLGPLLPNQAQLMGGLGYLGVSIFFYISGFVICAGLLREHDEIDRFSIRAFYIRRIFRILPAMWLYLVAVAL